MSPQRPLLRKVDSLQLHVPNLEAGLSFYRDALGHPLRWRTDEAVGLALPEQDAEIVLQTERPGEIDILVESAQEAAEQFQAAGGKALTPIFETRIGQGVVVEDPWGNVLVLLDLKKGLLLVDNEGRVVGNASPVPRYVIRRIHLAHCARGPEQCQKCREMDREVIALLDVNPPDYGMVARRLTQVTIDGEKTWREFEIARLFSDEQEARDYAAENGVEDVEL